MKNINDISAYDVNNGDVVVSFGDTYVHSYDKDTQSEQLADDLQAYFDGSNTANWDNNELEIKGNENCLQKLEDDETTLKFYGKDYDNTEALAAAIGLKKDVFKKIEKQAEKSAYMPRSKLKAQANKLHNAQRDTPTKTKSKSNEIE